ncbi:MAG: hypothetical protein WCF93_03025 [Candidatus Moraniibacteriota bacterium]|jgi:hypothetical protein
MASDIFLKRITNSIIKNSPKTGIFILAVLWDLGNATAESFFSPKYSFTKPTRALFGLDDEKFQKLNIKQGTIRQNLRRLRLQGIVKNTGSGFSLTTKGKEVIEKIIRRKNFLKKKWDGQYRLVIFDIPEKKRNARNWLRSELYMLEYSQLQLSVFIGKKPLPEDIIEKIQLHKITGYVNYLLVKNVYDKKRIK